MLCREYSFEEVDLEECVEVLCYPYTYGCPYIERIEELKRSGIEKLISFGKTRIGNISVVGKGHAAIVVLAKHRLHGIVAIKIRRVDSKRTSILHEGELLEIASRIGVAPRVYSYTHDFIVRDFVDGPTFRDFVAENMDRKDVLSKAVASLLYACYRLDSVGIDLGEISIPLTQVVYLCGDPSKPMFIDFESAKKSERSSNVTKVLGFIIGRNIFGKPFRELLGLDSEAIAKLRELAHEYKRSSYREAILEAMEKTLMGWRSQ